MQLALALMAIPSSAFGERKLAGWRKQWRVAWRLNLWRTAGLLVAINAAISTGQPSAALAGGAQKYQCVSMKMKWKWPAQPALWHGLYHKQCQCQRMQSIIEEETHLWNIEKRNGTWRNGVITMKVAETASNEEMHPRRPYRLAISAGWLSYSAKWP